MIDRKSTENAKLIKDHIENYDTAIGNINSRCDGTDTRLEDIEEQLDLMSTQMKELNSENMLLRKRVFQLEKVAKVCTEKKEELKRQNILIQGIVESPYKKTKSYVTDLLKFLGVNVNSSTVTSIYRVGPKRKKTGRSRPIKVKFSSNLSKQEMFKNITKLKDSEDWKGIGINDDLSEEKLSKQHDLRALAALARSKGQTAQQRGDYLIINDQKFSYRDIDDLPLDLSLEDAKLRPTIDGVAFQGPHVFLSNLADI